MHIKTLTLIFVVSYASNVIGAGVPFLSKETESRQQMIKKRRAQRAEQVFFYMAISPLVGNNKENLEFAKTIITANPQVVAFSPGGKNLLHLAVDQGPELVPFLLQLPNVKGFINLRDSDDQTALSHAGTHLQKLLKHNNMSDPQLAQIKELIINLFDAGADTHWCSKDQKELLESIKVDRAEVETKATRVVFENLNWPLLNVIVDTHIAEYLGVPINAQRQERERMSEEEEKERTVLQCKQQNMK